jgi:uncharacterized cupin superfamily protein
LKIDGATVAAMELPDRDPFETIDGGALGTRGVNLWHSADGTIVTGVWECDAGRFHADFSEDGECIHVVRGELVCTADADGTVTTLRPGDTMVFPRGWTGEWDVRVPLRKIYSNWRAR